MEPANSTSPCRMMVIKLRSRPRLLLPRSLARSLTKTRSRSTPLIRFCFPGSFSRFWLRFLCPRPHRSQPPRTLLHPQRKRERRRSKRQLTHRQMRNQRLRSDAANDNTDDGNGAVRFDGVRCGNVIFVVMALCFGLSLL
ncbi:hypothetical protein HN51_016208 [Arachis hypogaea]